MADLVDNVVGQLRLDASSPAQHQVAAFLRDRIESGRLPPGSRLPSLRRLADLWDIPFPTVQRGLKPLIDDKLLIPMIGRGTRVRAPKVELTCVGVYDTNAVELHTEMAFGRALTVALRGLLKTSGLDTRMFVDLRSRQEKDTPHPEVVRACERGDIQSLIMLGASQGIVRWVEKLPVPTTFLSESRPDGVTTEGAQFMDAAVRELARQGCRSVGLIAPITANTRCAVPHAASLPAFLNAASGLKLKTHASWIQTRASETPAVFSHEQYGYERFMRLWRPTPHPDGLVVFDDVTARGVVSAILERGVRVPDELRLVFHRNKEIPFHCPVRATFLELSVRECAAAIIEHMRRQFHDRVGERVVVPFRFSSGRRVSEHGTK